MTGELSGTKNASDTLFRNTPRVTRTPPRPRGERGTGAVGEACATAEAEEVGTHDTDL